MPARLRHAAGVAAAVICIALALPAGVLANGGGTCNASACKVYTEGPGTAGGGQSQGPGSGSTSSPSTVKPAHISPKVSHLLSHAGKDKSALHAIASLPGYGAQRGAKFFDAGTVGVATPSALGAAVDLGAGPTILLAILLATAVAFALHGWRRRRPSS